MKPTPPRLPLKLLRMYCSKEHIEELEGNLIELFENDFQVSPRRARINFTRNVLTHFRPEFIRPLFRKKLHNPFFMFRHHFVMASRAIMRYKSACAINMIGLTAGLTSAMLIMLWVMDEMNVNKHNTNDTRLYQVMQNIVEDGDTRTGDGTPGILAEALRNEIPEVEFATAVVPPSWFYQEGTALFNDKPVKASFQFADENFSNVFTLDYIRGSEQPLTGKYQVAVSEELAGKLFGNRDDAVGKTIEFRWQHFRNDYEIVSVFRSLAANATEQFDILLNYEMFIPPLQKR